MTTPSDDFAPLLEKMKAAARSLPAGTAPSGETFRGLLQGLSLESPAVREARRAAEAKQTLRAADGPGASALEAERQRLMDVARQFESFFFSLMMKEMRSTIHKSELVDGGRGEEVFQKMLDEEISGAAAKGQGFGLARMLYDQMARHVTADEPDGLDVEG